MKRRNFYNPQCCYLEVLFDMTLVAAGSVSLLKNLRICSLTVFEKYVVLLPVFFFFPLAAGKLGANLVLI